MSDESRTTEAGYVAKLIASLRMEVSAIAGLKAVTAIPTGFHEGLEVLGRKMGAAADELERLSGEPPGKPVPCWCPYCDQPHTPRIQEADPRPPTKPCTCPDTTASACGVERGSTLGKLWHCRRQQETKAGSVS